jgi:putative transcriptional regulator
MRFFVLTLVKCFDIIKSQWKANFTFWRLVLKNRLEEFRKEKGMSQEELAEFLEVSRQTISSLENGRYNPSILLAFRIARFFNKSIEEIFIYEEGKNVH